MIKDGTILVRTKSRVVEPWSPMMLAMWLQNNGFTILRVGKSHVSARAFVDEWSKLGIFPSIGQHSIKTGDPVLDGLAEIVEFVEHPDLA